MVKLNGRRIDEYGQTIFDQDGLCSALMSDMPILNLLAEDIPAIRQFNQLYTEWDNGSPIVNLYVQPTESISEYHKIRQQRWMAPASYRSIDVKQWLLARCGTQVEIDRVNLEYDLFVQNDMIPVLIFLIYFVDYLRSHSIIWGIGRGSSVASFCLFLIGIHRINPIIFGLDIHEFLRNNS